MEKNDELLSLAIALPIIVLPVPEKLSKQLLNEKK